MRYSVFKIKFWVYTSSVINIRASQLDLWMLCERLTRRLDVWKLYSAAAQRVSAVTLSHSVSLEAMRMQPAARQYGETGIDREADRNLSIRETDRGNTVSSQPHSQHTWRETKEKKKRCEASAVTSVTMT